MRLEAVAAPDPLHGADADPDRLRHRRRPGGHEALLPAPHCGLALARLPHDLDRAEPVTGEQHDAGAPDVLLRTVPIRHDRFQSEAIHGANSDTDSLAHAADSHAAKPRGIRFRILPSGFIH